MDILSKKILIIESDEIIRNIVNSNLKAVGFNHIQSATSGVDAISLVESRTLDIIIVAIESEQST